MEGDLTVYQCKRVELFQEMENLGSVDSCLQKAAEDTEFAEFLGVLSDTVAVAVSGMSVSKLFLQLSPRLQCVSCFSVGTDHIDIPACEARGIPVGHTPGVLTNATADIAFSLILIGARNLGSANRTVMEGRWDTFKANPSYIGRELSGDVLGIVGYGAIGQAVARRAEGFGMQVIYSSPSEKDAGKQAGHTHVSLDELLKRSLIVCVCAPLLPSTVGMLSAPQFKLMRSDSVLVNVGRGKLVNTEDLMSALREPAHGPSGAALDVTDPEPLPVTHPLLADEFADVVYVLPHMGSATVQTRSTMGALVCRNILNVLQGGDMEKFVTKTGSFSGTTASLSPPAKKRARNV